VIGYHPDGFEIGLVLSGEGCFTVVTTQSYLTVK